MITILSEIEQDALLEVLNLGMGRAADALSRMVDEEVLLSVPRLFFISLPEACRMIGDDPAATMSAVRQLFSGPFIGSSLLIYPRAKSLELIRCLLREEVSLEECQALEQESLTEVGNIILNACLGCLANLMELEIHCELPEYLQATCDALLGSHTIDAERTEKILLLYVDFLLRDHAVKGEVVLLFDTVAITHLKNELAGILKRYEN
ncbi:MAG: chemotaxis protein CheX [Magnetococcales bacterium]|nr:chemotaxis protein CheX [Magnetococcales bacterium]